MHKPSQAIRTFIVLTLVVSAIIFGYPAAFIVQHGWSSAGWPDGLLTPVTWFTIPIFIIKEHSYLEIGPALTAYWHMFHSESPAFAEGGFVAIMFIAGSTAFLGAIIFVGGTRIPLRDKSDLYGNAKWASKRDRARMNKGLEIGLDPDTQRPIRIQVEGNLLTIAPPRTGKTGGLIIPNLAFPEQNAWGGPAVVIDPKGDAYRAVKRRREALGKKVRCLDPLGLVDGSDRWNPLLRIDPTDVLYLQGMASALANETVQESEAGAFFRNSAADLIVAAIVTAIKNNRTDIAAAAALLTNPADFQRLLEQQVDKGTGELPAILRSALGTLTTGDDRTKSNMIETAKQNTRWLIDDRMSLVVQNHTFELDELCNGDADLFIVLPADNRKTILAPYVRWLLADLFNTVRRNRPAERIIAFIDEANVLGRFQELSDAAGELPGYGLSLWTFWQSRFQLENTYGEAGAEIFMGTAEMTSIFNLPAAQPDELERWSDAIGNFTVSKPTNTRDAKTGKTTVSYSPEAARLAPPTTLQSLLNRWQVVLLNGPAHTPDRLTLGRVSAYTDTRFEDLIERTQPVGRIA